MKKAHLPVYVAVLAIVVLVIPGVRGNTPSAVTNSGWYDHQIIEYKGTPEITSSPQAAQLIAQGNIVFHIVDANGHTPAVQCAPLLAALPQDVTSCNVLNFVPTEVGYTGGAWNLQIFHWKNGVTPTLLSKDDDIIAAVNAGQGTLEITPTLVRCPVVDFAALR
ncbi:MAG TPA: hypothetical protein VE955_05780 [Candidatus Dormibacteraeota bacterium]|nr:hypothetical protein [Candidatus Dormibacteraeota bacterium]